VLYIILYIQSNLQIVKKIKSLYLPRNDTDNYKANDRIINNTDNIKQIVIQNGGMVLDTYRLNNINYQFTIVNNADIIILDYGSSLYFNCIFLKNKKIYVLDDRDLYTGQIALESVRLLYKKIADNNDVKIITTHNLSLFEDITK
jgi:capsular polysaccharide biosynthesis protein